MLSIPKRGDRNWCKDPRCTCSDVTADASVSQDLLADYESPSSDDYRTDDQFVGYQTGRGSDIKNSEQPTDLSNALFFDGEQFTSKVQTTGEEIQSLGTKRRNL